jgi:hypothetical protein
MMNKLKKTYKCRLIAWLLWWGGLLFSASAYAQTSMPSAWRATPTMSTDVLPSYQFRSTSAYMPVVGYTSSAVYSPSAMSRPRRSPWDEGGDDEGNPNGDALGNVPTGPVGEPIVLFALAMIYFLIRTCTLFLLPPPP